MTRHLGTTNLKPDVHVVDLRPGDRILVATDGLLDGTQPRRIRDVATSRSPIHDVADELLAEALRHGTDNVTIVVWDPFDEGAVSASSA